MFFLIVSVFGVLGFLSLLCFVGTDLCFVLMSQARQFQMVGGNNNIPGHQYNDTTFTKIFVGGLAWETQRETMRRYFEQFGEILEAVVITDKNTGRSKGYGFVCVTLYLLWILVFFIICMYLFL